MLRFFTYLIVLVLIFSCKKDRKIEPQDVKLSGLLKGILIKSKGVEEKYSFEYLDSLTIKTISYTINGASISEDYTYENDTLKTSQIGDTLKNYIYSSGRLLRIEKHLISSPSIYEMSVFSYNGAGKVSNIVKRKIDETNNIYLGETTYTWSGSNISLARERYSNGLIEEFTFQYDETFNPLYEFSSEILRIPSEKTDALSLNNPSASMGFFSGIRYRMEGTYLDNKLPITRTIYTFDENLEAGEWTLFKEYTFEYYE